MANVFKTFFQYLNMKPFIYFLISSALFIFVLVYFSGNEYLNIYSICSQLFSICLIGAFFDTNPSIPQNYNIDLNVVLNQQKNTINPYLVVERIETKKIKNTIIIILIFTLILGIINAYIIVNRLNIDDNTNHFLQLMSFTSLGITQFGGWFFQSVLIYTLSNILGARLIFNSYLKIVGIAYIGFLILSLFTLVFNFLYLPNNISTEHFNDLIENSLVYSISGKVAEFFVLSIIAYGISVNENFKSTKSLFICFFPSFLLLTFKYIFDLII